MNAALPPQCESDDGPRALALRLPQQGATRPPRICSFSAMGQRKLNQNLARAGGGLSRFPRWRPGGGRAGRAMLPVRCMGVQHGGEQRPERPGLPCAALAAASGGQAASGSQWQRPGRLAAEPRLAAMRCRPPKKQWRSGHTRDATNLRVNCHGFFTLSFCLLKKFFFFYFEEAAANVHSFFSHFEMKKIENKIRIK